MKLRTNNLLPAVENLYGKVAPFDEMRRKIYLSVSKPSEEVTKELESIVKDPLISFYVLPYQNGTIIEMEN